MQKLHFGILGCGMIAEYHAKALSALPNARLIGAADAQVENARVFCQKHDIVCYNTPDELLADPQIDAICICTPSGFHAQNAIAALNAGKHVVLEKPMAITVAQTEQIEAACAQSGKMLTVISQTRFMPDVARVKELIDKGAFGKIVLCSLSMPYWRNENYYASSSWKGTKQMDGGVLLNQGIHGVDMMLYLMGDARVADAVAHTVYHNIEAPDTAAALLTFKNGALGTLVASTCTNPSHARQLEILGTEGCAIFDDVVLEKLVVKGQTLVERNTQGLQNSSSDPAAFAHSGHTLQLQNFVNAVLGQEELLIDVHEGSRAVALIEAIQTKKSETDQ